MKIPDGNDNDQTRPSQRDEEEIEEISILEKMDLEAASKGWRRVQSYNTQFQCPDINFIQDSETPGQQQVIWLTVR